MTPAQVAALLPMTAIGLGALVAMMLAPLHRRLVAHVAAGAGLVAGLGLTLLRIGVPEAPLGHLYTDDGLARFGTAFACLSSLGGLVFMRVDIDAKEAPALTAIVALGASALAGADHAATLFLGLEMVTLSLIALFAFPLTELSLEAAYKFLVASGLSSAGLLFGVAILYAITGTLHMSAWSGAGLPIALGAALVLGGLAFKFSLVPFHMWTPDAFEGAPAAAVALTGVTSKAAVAIALLRLGEAGAMPQPLWTQGLAVLAMGSILVGNLLALRQPSLPRMLGYSTIAHSGYMAAILASGGAWTHEALLFYLGAYAPALMAALCASAFLGSAPTLEGIRGAAARRPWESAALSLSLLSLAGLPVAGGFIGKLYLFSSLVSGQAWTLLAAAIAGSALGFYYYARFLLAPFLGEAGAGSSLSETHDRALLAMCSALVILFGVFPMSLMWVVASALAR